MKTFLTTALFLFSLSAAANCPLGAHEDHLTIQRVMRNFGKYSMNADSVAVTGTQTPEDVTNAEIQQAITDLAVVLDCSQAILDNPTGDLLPGDAADHTGADQKKFIAEFLDFMTQFHQMIGQYQTQLQNLLTTAVASRDYAALNTKRQQIDDFVSTAHDKF